MRLEQAINALETNNMPALIEALADDQNGNITRLDVEFCPKCYGDGSRLVVANKAENNTWEEKIAWEGRLEPKYIQELMQGTL